MKLLCIKEESAYWGSILEIGKFYTGYTMIHTYSIVTNNEKYWHHNQLILSSREWIQKGYKQDTLHEVIPGYLQYREVMEKYTIKVEIPVITVICDDSHTNTYCSMTKEEILNKWNVELNKKGEIAFTTTVKMAEDYFLTVEQIRDNKLKDLGI
jgi:hypothetical protein